MDDGADPDNHESNGPDDRESDGSGRGRQLIASVLVIAVLLVAGLWLTGALRQNSNIQDCVAAGRTNCAPVAQ